MAQNNSNNQYLFNKSDSWNDSGELAISINNASIDGMITLDVDLVIISCNAVIADWSGYTCEKLVGKSFFEVFPTAQSTPGLKNALTEALAGRKSFLPSEAGFYLEGHFETHIVPLKNHSGKINGLLQIIHDVAHRVKAENQLRDLNEQLKFQYTELQHFHEEMATFAKITAHDLKEPVRKIYTFAEEIKTNDAGNLSDRGKGLFRRIQTSLQRMNLLLDDLGNFLSLGNTRNDMEIVDLNEILARVLDDFREEINNFGATIHTERLPEIYGYPIALEQLFRQLITNALKFRQTDEPLVIAINCNKIRGKSIPHDEARKSETYYCLTFSDNGIGFEPEYHARIFELFQQLHPHGAYKGSGKGLAIALKVARMHKGFIKVESEPGKGSTFCCFIPILKNASVAET